MDVMTPQHPRWDEFAERLEGPGGCNFRKDEEDGIIWNCPKLRHRPLATAILTAMGDIDVPASLAYFKERGGYCDCEILFNVNP